MTILYTSLAEIQSFNPCYSGWRDIQKATIVAGIKYEEMFPLKKCLESNSFSDVCWLLSKRNKEISICVQAAKKCANSVKHLNNSYAAAADSAAAAAADNQRKLNKQFLLESIIEYENNN